MAHLPQYLILGSSLGKAPAMSQQQHAGLLQGQLLQQQAVQLLGQHESLGEWCPEQEVEVVQG
ncbi:TPA: hypothetical protein ACH3X2_007366 [Trebouxia sp. C0005]